MGYSSANLYEFQVDLKFNYLSPSLKKKNRGCVQMKKKARVFKRGTCKCNCLKAAATVYHRQHWSVNMLWKKYILILKVVNDII